jgi:hypothetical protein
MPKHPVAIGGVGGSGTRLVAGLLLQLGYFLGSDLNEPLDNLWFTLFFKRLEALSCPDAELARDLGLFVRRMEGRAPLDEQARARVVTLASMDRPQHDRLWLQARASSFLADCDGKPVDAPWGWKEPNTHIAIPRLLSLLPTLHYIHVMRNGLDMAFSQNQNQANLWGRLLLDLGDESGTPRASLRFWCWAHKRMLEIARRWPERAMFLNYDRLCLDPLPSLTSLLQFLGIAPKTETIDTLRHSIRIPESIGRFRMHGTADLDPGDVSFVASLGFPIE